MCPLSGKGLQAGEQVRVDSGGVIKVLCHRRRFEEETSDNETAVEEGEEEAFAEKSSPDTEECPAVKVGRAGAMGRLTWGK